MRKILFILILPCLLYSQTGNRKAWVDTLRISNDSSWTLIQTMIDSRANDLITDSIGVVDNWWDVIWNRLIVTDSTGDLDVELWNTDKYQIRAATTDPDTVISLPFYMKNEVDSVEFAFRYKTENSSNGGSVILTAGATADTVEYSASTVTLTKRQVMSASGMANGAVYSIQVIIEATDVATDFIMWPVSIAILRKK